jgi:hypothetical protein
VNWFGHHRVREKVVMGIEKKEVRIRGREKNRPLM